MWKAIISAAPCEPALLTQKCPCFSYHFLTLYSKARPDSYRLFGVAEHLTSPRVELGKFRMFHAEKNVLLQALNLSGTPFETTVHANRALLGFDLDSTTHWAITKVSSCLKSTCAHPILRRRAFQLRHFSTSKTISAIESLSV